MFRVARPIVQGPTAFSEDTSDDASCIVPTPQSLTQECKSLLSKCTSPKFERLATEEFEDMPLEPIECLGPRKGRKTKRYKQRVAKKKPKKHNRVDESDF